MTQGNKIEFLSGTGSTYSTWQVIWSVYVTVPWPQNGNDKISSFGGGPIFSSKHSHTAKEQALRILGERERFKSKPWNHYYVSA